MVETHTSARTSERQSSLQRTAEVLVLAAATLPGIGSSAWAQSHTTIPEPEPQRASHVKQVDYAYGAVQVQDVTDFVQRWSPGKQLYIQGDVGLEPVEIAQIKAVLAEHPDWTVYLVQKAEGQRFVAADGTESHDVMAVLNGIRTGLAAREDFKAIVDQKSGKQSGAVLMISFDADPENRQVSYYSGQYQVDLGYGWNRWQRNLDRIAIARLRDNRDVVGAVQDTVEHIDGGTAAAIRRAEQLDAALPYLGAAGGLVGLGIGLAINASVRADRWYRRRRDDTPDYLPDRDRRFDHTLNHDGVTQGSDTAVETGELPESPALAVASALKAISEKKEIAASERMIGEMAQAGLVRSYTADEGAQIQRDARPYAEAVEKRNFLKARWLSITDRLDQLEVSLSSPMYRLGHHLTLRWGKLAREEREEQGLREEKESLYALVADHSVVLDDLERKEALADSLTPFNGGFVRLTDQGRDFLIAAAKLPTRLADVSYTDAAALLENRREVFEAGRALSTRNTIINVAGGVALLSEAIPRGISVDEVDERLKKVSAADGVRAQSAMMLVSASLRTGASIEKLSADFAEAFVANGHDQIAAAHLAVSAAATGRPIASMIELRKKFSEVEPIGTVAASLLASAASDNEQHVDELIAGYKEAFKVAGLDDVGAAQVAIVALRTRKPLPDVLELWKEAYKVDGLDGPSATLLACTAADRNLPIDRLISDWREIKAVDGATSLVSAHLAVTAEGSGLPAKALAEEFSYHYQGTAGRTGGYQGVVLALCGGTVGLSDSPNRRARSSSYESISRSDYDGFFTTPMLLMYGALLLSASSSSSSSSSSYSFSSSSSSSGYGGSLFGGGSSFGVSMGGFGGGGISSSGW